MVLLFVLNTTLLPLFKVPGLRLHQILTPTYTVCSSWLVASSIIECLTYLYCLQFLAYDIIKTTVAMVDPTTGITPPI